MSCILLCDVCSFCSLDIADIDLILLNFKTILNILPFYGQNNGSALKNNWSVFLFYFIFIIFYKAVCCDLGFYQ